MLGSWTATVDIEDLRAHFAAIFPDDPERQARWLAWALELFQYCAQGNPGRHTGTLH
jgi:hypothetical protein